MEVSVASKENTNKYNAIHLKLRFLELIENCFKGLLRSKKKNQMSKLCLKTLGLD